MAILRAGPWGNLSDSYQPVPPNTGADGLTFYPVNCAKADWPGQTWGAYYEVEVSGCCTPAQIEVTFPYTDNFGATIQYHTTTIDRGPGDFNVGECEYIYSYPDASYYDPVQYVFALTHDGTNWNILFGNFYFAYTDSTSFVGDECDPVTSFTITSSLNGIYDGYDITITDPNA
jgi:hypothetical protein